MDRPEKIKYIRTVLLNKSQEAFARNIGVNRNAVKSWENGLSTPTVSHLLMISMVGEVSLDYLLFSNTELQLYIRCLDDGQYNILKELIDYFRKKVSAKETSKGLINNQY